jgi:CBS domain-containing protein
MLVKDLMSPQLELATTQTTLAEAARLMSDKDLGYLPVGNDTRLIGAVTDRDIVVRGLAKGFRPDALITDVMSEDLIFCLETDTIDQAAKLMQTHQIRRLSVVNDENRLCGIITLGDIARQAEDIQLTGGTETRIARETA